MGPLISLTMVVVVLVVGGVVGIVVLMVLVIVVGMAVTGARSTTATLDVGLALMKAMGTCLLSGRY
ncbi:MAG: hypothetical protein MUP80_15940 [Acidobacteriia bacterium]|nr:hypothetical protein [Terriglobia bacterium]